jgi:hypothetical protein
MFIFSSSHARSDSRRRDVCYYHPSTHSDSYLLFSSLEKLTELHENNRQLARRTKDLEVALAEAHSLMTSEPHTLLRDDLLCLKNVLLQDHNQTSSGKNFAQTDVAVDMFSSL